VTEGVVLVDETTEVEGQIKKVFHVVGEQVPTNILAVLELFVKNTNTKFEFGLLVFGDEDDEGLGEWKVLFEGGVVVELLDFLR
jgi:hypothetical protein